MENELVDLIDELLERDAGTVNSTIIGKLFRYSPSIEDSMSVDGRFTKCGCFFFFF